MPKRAPIPTKSADMVKEYLDIIESKKTLDKRARRYDIYRRAGSGAQTDKVLKFLKETGLIEGDKNNGYMKTKRGEEMHDMLRKRELVGILTRNLSGRRIRHK